MYSQISLYEPMIYELLQFMNSTPWNPTSVYFSHVLSTVSVWTADGFFGSKPAMRKYHWPQVMNRMVLGIQRLTNREENVVGL